MREGEDWGWRGRVGKSVVYVERVGVINSTLDLIFVSV